MTQSNLCPCGSTRPFDGCCGRYLDGHATPLTAEALMRSRYCAFVLKKSEYLLSSWHPSTRPTELNLEDDPVEWLGLTIESSRGGESDQNGEVTFCARFSIDGEVGELVERSRFIKEDGAWLYVDGEQLTNGKHEKVAKVGRNSPCPCGSGKKYKRCCGG